MSYLKIDDNVFDKIIIEIQNTVGCAEVRSASFAIDALRTSAHPKSRYRDSPVP